MPTLFELAVSVGAPDGVRSRIWKTLAKSNGDAFIVGLGYGPPSKVTIHKPKPPEFPHWQMHLRGAVDLSKPGVPQIREGENVVQSDEHTPIIASWPGDWLDGETLIAATVVIPASELRQHPPTEHGERAIHWLSAPPADGAVELVWAIGKSKATPVSPTAPHSGVKILAQAEFSNGATLSVAYVHVRRPELAERLVRVKARMEAIFAKTPTGTRQRYAEGRFFTTEFDETGLGTLWDVAVN